MERLPKNFLRELRAGDPALYERLVAEHSIELRRYASRFTRDDDELDELVSATWAIAWLKRGQYRGRGPIPAWLTRICRSIAIRRVNSARRFSDFVQRHTPETSQPAARQDNGATRDAFLDNCMNAVALLPERQRFVVIARVVLGLSVLQTPERMKCRPGTVKATLHAVLKSLNTKLVWKGDDEPE